MSWVDHVHHTGVSRCFWYLGWRKTSALPYLFLYIVQYCIKHTHTHSTILGWCLGLPLQEILTRTSDLPWMMDQFSNGSIPNAWQVGKNYLVQAISGPVSKTFKNIQEPHPRDLRKIRTMKCQSPQLALPPIWKGIPHTKHPHPLPYPIPHPGPCAMLGHCQ
jgi:hypothetical protein